MSYWQPIRWTDLPLVCATKVLSAGRTRLSLVLPIDESGQDWYFCELVTGLSVLAQRDDRACNDITSSGWYGARL